MSMHEIEDLVHASILVLDKASGDDDRLRDWFVRLYEFQNTYDCSWTMGRVEEILIRRRHTYRFPVSAHPDYALRQSFFDGLTGFTELSDPDSVFDEDDGWGNALDDGYFDAPWLYCEAGTALWRRMVATGHLTGADAAAPRPVPLIDVVLAVAAAAEKDGDAELIALWWGLGPDAIAEHEPFLSELPAAIAFREIVRRSGALSVPLPDGYRPSDERLDALDDDRETWWYRLEP
jgi:hypothetical protein